MSEERWYLYLDELSSHIPRVDPSQISRATKIRDQVLKAFPEETPGFHPTQSVPSEGSLSLSWSSSRYSVDFEIEEEGPTEWTFTAFHDSYIIGGALKDDTLLGRLCGLLSRVLDDQKGDCQMPEDEGPKRVKMEIEVWDYVVERLKRELVELHENGGNKDCTLAELAGDVLLGWHRDVVQEERWENAPDAVRLAKLEELFSLISASLVNIS